MTIATNMAGRGTDIQLGGNFDMRFAREREENEKAWGREMTAEELADLRTRIMADIETKKARAMELGGLYVLGTERHESRRIDNQLRGRTGRQGDPGRSKFYLSCEDDLLRIFGGDRLKAIMSAMKIEEDEPVEEKMMSKAMEISQKRVEARNFEIRKNLLKYDDVINEQRKQIFEERKDFMRAATVEETVADMRAEVVEDMCARTMPPKLLPEQWDADGLETSVREVLGLELPVKEWIATEGVDDADIQQKIAAAADEAWAAKVAMIGPDQTRGLEKQVLLQTIDAKWREHLVTVDHLRAVIHLRGYGQRDPLIEYKTEAFSLFETMRADLRKDVTATLMNLQVVFQQPAGASGAPVGAGGPIPDLPDFGADLDRIFGGATPDWATLKPLPETGLDEMGAASDDLVPSPLGPMPRAWLDTPRNAPCPCGSGKKFKHCHGAV